MSAMCRVHMIDEETGDTLFARTFPAVSLPEAIVVAEEEIRRTGFQGHIRLTLALRLG
jgi:hypothetical protein